MRNLFILGCGWLGLQVARRFASEGWDFVATTTSHLRMAAIGNTGAAPVLCSLESPIAHETLSLLHACSHILVSLPAPRGGSPGATSSRAYRELMDAVRVDTALIALSTSGIYPRESGVIDETTYDNCALDQSLLTAEQAVAEGLSIVTTLRLGGLCGPGRIPGSWYQGRECDVGNDRSNYVHSSDVVEAIMACTALKEGRRTYNVVSPDHPLKRDIFALMAKRYGFSPPIAVEKPGLGRIISSARSQRELGLHYAYPSPLSY